jgi:hypothetical protein
MMASRLLISASHSMRSMAVHRPLLLALWGWRCGTEIGALADDHAAARGGRIARGAVARVSRKHPARALRSPRLNTLVVVLSTASHSSLGAAPVA